MAILGPSMRRFPLRPRLLSLLFVDISLQKSGEAEKSKYFPIDRFHNDHGCRDRKPNGGSGSMAERASHCQRRFLERSRPGRAGLARPRRPAAVLDALSAVRFPETLATAGRRAREPFAIHRRCL